MSTCGNEFTFRIDKRKYLSHNSLALPYILGHPNGVNGDGWKYQYEKDRFEASNKRINVVHGQTIAVFSDAGGKLVVDQFGRAAKFSHRNEIANPIITKFLIMV